MDKQFSMAEHQDGAPYYTASKVIAWMSCKEALSVSPGKGSYTATCSLDALYMYI